MMMGAHIAKVGRELLLIAYDVSSDVNERYLLTHDALQLLLRENASLSQTSASHLRMALSAALRRRGMVATAISPTTDDPERALLFERAVSRWENEGGARPHAPPILP